MEASQAPSAPPGDPLVGLTLDGRYTVRRRIGEGGMGIVYEAKHAVIGKRVAVKVLRRDYSSRQDVVDRFRQEAQSASRVESPHIIDISDFGQTPDGDSYFVMEFLEGEDLSNRIREGHSLDADLALKIAIECCDALGAAHAAHIVHRDMKPENIFLTTRRGDPTFVKIVDFGIAKMNDVSTDAPTMKKLTKTGMIFGTPEYMSPEQAAGKSMDYRVDIYAMGVILYEMFAGRVPYLGETFMGVLTQHMFDAPPAMREINPNAEYPPAVEEVILRCMQKEPEDRYQSMEELGDALRSCLKSDSTQAVISSGTQMGWANTASSAPPRVPKLLEAEGARASEFPLFGERNRSAGMLLALFLGASVLGLGVWFWSQRGEQSATLAAEAAESEREGAEGEQIAETPATATAAAGSIPEGVAATEELTYPITIAFDYKGARVYLNDELQDCPGSPCTVKVSDGSYRIDLAVDGNVRGEKRVDIAGGPAAVEFLMPRTRRGTKPTKEPGEIKTADVTTSGGLSREEAASIAREEARKEVEKNRDYSAGGDLMNPDEELRKEEKLPDDKLKPVDP